jgi:uracil phosphoribosyltransferase
MPSVHVIEHPIIQTKLTELRDFATPHAAFRALLEEIAMLMTYEVTRDIPTVPRVVQTPLEKTTGHALAKPVTLVPVLRAGLGMTDGVLRVLSNARVGHLGVRRNEETLEPIEYYKKLPPDIADTEVLLIDPMLATGGSAVAAMSYLKSVGVVSMKFVCLVAAPEGIAMLNAHHPDVPIYCCAIDRQLDHRGYILPGLGDAGDRVFGT